MRLEFHKQVASDVSRIMDYYRIVEDRVRVLVVRHHKRRPSLGLRRS
jgi:plasmid stabilization system protein ParE